jgi:hypothetical protein
MVTNKVVKQMDSRMVGITYATQMQMKFLLNLLNLATSTVTKLVVYLMALHTDGMAYVMLMKVKYLLNQLVHSLQ